MLGSVPPIMGAGPSMGGIIMGAGPSTGGIIIDCGLSIMGAGPSIGGIMGAASGPTSDWRSLRPKNGRLKPDADEAKVDMSSPARCLSVSVCRA